MTEIHRFRTKTRGYAATIQSVEVSGRESQDGQTYAGGKTFARSIAYTQAEAVHAGEWPGGFEIQNRTQEANSRIMRYRDETMVALAWVRNRQSEVDNRATRG